MSRPVRPLLVSVPCPPDDMRPLFRFLKVRPGTAYPIVLGSPHFFGCNVHYTDNHTLPCTAEFCPCYACQLGVAFRWAGFGIALVGAHLGPYMLQIGKAAWNHCPALNQHSGDLRGWEVVLRRLGPAKNAPLKVEWTGRKLDKPLPELPDVADVLAKLWDISLGQ